MNQFEPRKPELQTNLHNLYRHSTADERIQGKEWYPSAHATIAKWAQTYNHPLATAACVTAALSPQVSWERNLTMAHDILSGLNQPSIGGVLHSNLRKAITLRDNQSSADPQTQMAQVFPGGPKVTSFAANLYGQSHMVTIDAHAIQAALNDPLATYGLKWSPYLTFASVYAAVAYELGIEPSAFQAIIWLTWKRLHPTQVKRVNRRKW
jgi:hypothetical protein